MKTGILESETENDDEMIDLSLFRMNYFLKESRDSRTMLTAEEHLHLTRLTKGLYPDTTNQLPKKDEVSLKSRLISEMEPPQDKLGITQQDDEPYVPLSSRLPQSKQVDDVLIGTIERMNYGLPSAPVRTEEVVVSVNHVTD